MEQRYDVIVVGGGHAGAEAAWAASATGARVGLVTLDPGTIGAMSCNPAIGGLAKGQMVREIDALGGIMGLAADATGIMFKVLNQSRGAAVRGPRAQCDKHAYARTVRGMLESREGVEIVRGAVERVEVEGGKCAGVWVRLIGEDEPGLMRAGAVVLTTGTFMRGLMHTGDERTPGGRAGEHAASAISDALRSMGFELNRLKTGTPPRLRRSTIDWESLDLQDGDDPPRAFSEMTDPARFPTIGQTDCRLTRTTAEAHALIRDNLHRAPMFSGQIESAGPRYCPSIEDKVVRFADRDSHQVFLEPESHEDESVYCNGIATSLPRDVQERIVRCMPGCERAEVLRWGYAVEYDCVHTHQIDASTMTKLVEGFFLAGQINGTTGYEEAAAQGVLAGLNAARWAAGREPVILDRATSYIGVMMDDLVTKTPVEPYRMFTSRAEHRLVLRADNAPDRLTPKAREWGLVDGERWARFEQRRDELERIDALIDGSRVDGVELSSVMRRPGFGEADLTRVIGGGWSAGALETALVERQYAGYIARLDAERRRLEELERRRIPAGVEFSSIEGMRAEAREVLSKFRPTTFGQARRLAGVNPADITLLAVAARRAGMGSGGARA